VIKFDFRADLVEHIDSSLVQLGYSINALGVERDNVSRYLMLLIKALRRVPAAKSRRVVMARGFVVPPDSTAGFKMLLKAIEQGSALRPWLSKTVTDPTFRDGLLDDWGIHHFHLGPTMDRKAAAFVSRTEVVAFAVVRPDVVYFLIATGHHSRKAPLVWTQTDLIDITHQNWPALITTPKSKPPGQALTAERHAEIREMRVNVGVTVSDGTVYYPPGGGSMSNGDGALDYIYQMQLFRSIDGRENAVRANEVQIRAALKLRADCELALKARYEIAFPEGFDIRIFESVSSVEVRLEAS